MAKDLQTARWDRAFKARALYEAHLYEPTPEGLLVFSQSGEGCYLVTDAGCSCPDATEGFAARLLGGHCKHAEVAAIVARAAQPGPRRLPPREDFAPLPPAVPNVVALAREAERRRRDEAILRPPSTDHAGAELGFKAERGRARG